MSFNSTDMILSNLIHDPEFNLKILEFINEEYMGESKTHSYILKQIKEYNEEYSITPSYDALVVMMSKDNTVTQDKAFRKELEKLYLKVKTHICSDDSLEFRIKQTEEHCKNMAFNDALFKCADLLDNNKVTQGEAMSLMEKVFEIDLNPDLGTDLEDDVDGYHDRLHDEQRLFPTGNRQLDVLLGGGLKRTGITLIVGCTNVGKTAFACDMASKFIEQGKNVFYFTKEADEDEIKERIYANLLDMPTYIMKDKGKTPKNIFTNRVTKSLIGKGKLHIKFDDSDSFTPNDIKSIVLSVEKKYGIKFDIVVTDNMSNLEPNKLKRRGNIRGDEMLVALTNDLRNASSKLKAHFICPEQSVLECEFKLHPSLQDIANAKGISRVLDNAIMLGVTEELREENRIMITIGKCRTNNSKGKHFMIGFDYSKQKSFDIESESNVSIDDNIEKVDPAIRKRMQDMSRKRLEKKNISKTRKEAEKRFNDI